MKLIVSSIILSFLITGCTTVVKGKKFKENEKDPAKAYLNLGVKYMQNGRYDLAESKLRRSIEIKKSPEAFNALALLYEQEHQNKLAEETYKELVAAYPKYPLGYSNYNIFLCKYNRTEQISRLATKMASNGSVIAAVGQIAAGDCEYSKGSKEKAASHYKKALQYEEYSAGALIPLARMDFEKGFVVEAKQKIDLVHNQIGYTSESLYLAVLIEKELGNASEERQMFRELYNRYPNSLELKKLSRSK